MKRVSIAEAKQTLPALVHEAEKLGQIELTRRGKTVAYLVSADRHTSIPRPTFLEVLERWREKYRDALGDDALELPRRRPARKVEIPE